MDFWAELKKKISQLIRRSPLHPYGVAYRRAYGSLTSGLSKKLLCSPVCGWQMRGGRGGEGARGALLLSLSPSVSFFVYQGRTPQEPPLDLRVAPADVGMVTCAWGEQFLDSVSGVMGKV